MSDQPPPLAVPTGEPGISIADQLRAGYLKDLREIVGVRDGDSLRAALKALTRRLASVERERDQASAAIGYLRERIQVTCCADGETPHLRLALLGQRSDVLFFSQWEALKRDLMHTLDVLDVAFPASSLPSSAPERQPE